jgi:3-mercaptopyruvate sulfurtransferase SseA
VALQLKRRGITRVRPLEGGLAQWTALGFPVRELPAPEIPSLETARPIQPATPD